MFIVDTVIAEKVFTIKVDSVKRSTKMTVSFRSSSESLSFLQLVDVAQREKAARRVLSFSGGREVNLGSDINMFLGAAFGSSFKVGSDDNKEKHRHRLELLSLPDELRPLPPPPPAPGHDDDDASRRFFSIILLFLPLFFVLCSSCFLN